MLEQVARRSWGCVVIVRVCVQVGWGFEQRDLLKDAPAPEGAVGLGDLSMYLPTQTVL